jgi:hypothetical protein
MPWYRRELNRSVQNLLEAGVTVLISCAVIVSRTRGGGFTGKGCVAMLLRSAPCSPERVSLRRGKRFTRHSVQNEDQSHFSDLRNGRNRAVPRLSTPGWVAQEVVVPRS